MMLDGGVVFIVITVLVTIAFIKGAYYAKKDRDSNPLDKYSSRDLQLFEEILKDIQKTKKS